MNSRFVVLLLLLAAAVGVCASNPFSRLSKKEIKFNTWVFLVAGSDGYSNYRHQADICHAYQSIHRLGVPDDHIIVMMMDDIAYHEKNRYPGKIFNSPLGPMGEDVYHGVPHDYTHELVTASIFKKILTGEEMTVGSNKTLRSGPNDNVFVFYDDHGDTDCLPFPDGSQLRSSTFKEIIDTMVEKQMFKNLIIYVEACFSGSLFYKLDLPPNVYATTAAPVATYSYSGCSGYCDAYSFAWIDDLDTQLDSAHTFNDQYDAMTEGTKRYSQCCQYGGADVRQQTIEDWFGPSFGRTRSNRKPTQLTELIPTLDVELVMAERLFKEEPTEENKRGLEKEIAIRNAVDAMGKAIVLAAKDDVPYLATVPCSTCSTACPCYKACYEDGWGSNRCTFECCNENSCYEDPPYNAELDKRQSCVSTLTDEFVKTCGRPHNYLLSTRLLFHRICKQTGINMTNAINEIHNQCSKFDINAF